jgi:hypothetical protein
MIIQRLYIILFFTFLVSCNNISPIFNSDIGEENEIINIVFDATVGHDTLWTKHFKLPVISRLPSIQLTDEYLIEVEKIKKERKNISARLDTSVLFVFFPDSTSKFPNNIDIISTLKPLNYEANFPDIDSSFRPLIYKLVNSTQSRHLDISAIKTNFKYKLEYSRNREKYPSDIVVIGNITISRVVFNENKTKACVYSEIRCGGLCAGGAIIFLDKNDGIWTIIGQKDLWVS